MIYEFSDLGNIYFKISSFCSRLVKIWYNWKGECLTQRDSIPMFCNFHNRKPARSYCRFSNFSQYQLTPWWRHDLDMFSAVVTFREGTFHEINNADWISNADLWWLFVVRLNKQSRVQLLVIWDAMPLTYRQCNDRGPGIIVDTLNLEDRAPVDFI